MKTRKQVADKLAQVYRARFNGDVQAGFDEQRRVYYIQGEGLPACKELRAQYPNGWCLLDYFTPRYAREITQ